MSGVWVCVSRPFTVFTGIYPPPLNKVCIWRAVAVSTRFEDWKAICVRAIIIISLGNPRVHKTHPVTLPLPRKGSTATFIKGSDPPLFTSCHFPPILYLSTCALWLSSLASQGPSHIIYNSSPKAPVCFKIDTRNPRPHAPIHTERTIPKGARPNKGN